MWRWVAKCVAHKAISDTASYLAPLQLGVGVRGGAEAIIHSASAIFHDADIAAADKWVLQIDFANAFNGISRARMLEVIQLQCPKALAWAEFCYGRHSHLFFGDTRFSSQSGAHQGDPLASLFFALILHPLLLDIKARHPSLLLTSAFLDDVTVVGKRSDLQDVYDFLHERGKHVGLSLNPAKSLVWVGDSIPADVSDPLDRGVPRASDGGYILLGAPIGDIPFSRDVVSSRIAKIAAIFDALSDINDAQIEYGLLRHCFSFPKLSYCLRTCDPQALLPIYDHFDSLQLRSLIRLLGRDLPETSCSQAFLPVKLGGGGLRSTTQCCAAAFIASTKQTSSIVDSILPAVVQRRSLASAFPLLQAHSGNAAYTSLDLLPPSSNQHSLSSEIDSHKRSLLLSSSNMRDRARLHSLALPHAGDWLDALPSPSLNLNMDSRSFGAAMGYRLGVPLLTEQECRSNSCDVIQDALGDHALHCRDDHGLKGGRHDRIRDKIYREAQTASMNPQKEMPGLIPGSLSRPADVYVEHWVDGRKVAFDVSVTSPTQEAILFQAADRPAAAIDARKASKNRAHLSDCRAQGIHFQPLVVETFGGWCPEAISYLKEIARLNARRWGRDSALEIKYLFQRLSISLQRGNAALIADRDVEPAH